VAQGREGGGGGSRCHRAGGGEGGGGGGTGAILHSLVSTLALCTRICLNPYTESTEVLTAHPKQTAGIESAARMILGLFFGFDPHPFSCHTEIEKSKREGRNMATL